MVKKSEKDKDGLLYAWGELNPVFKSNVQQSYSSLDTVYQNPISFAIRLAREANIKDARDKTSPYRGVVVRIEGPVSITKLSINSPWVQAYNEAANESKNADPLHSYKIYVPEIDLIKDPKPMEAIKAVKNKKTGRWSDPEIKGKARLEHEKIDKCRTYISIKSETPQAKLGQLVYVSFGDRTNLVDPIYMGPVYSKTTPPPPQLTLEAVEAYMNKKKEEASKPKPPPGYQRPQTGIENPLHDKPCQGLWGRLWGDVPAGKWREVQGGIYTSSEERHVECHEPEPTSAEKLAKETQIRDLLGYVDPSTSLPKGWENMSKSELKAIMKKKTTVAKATGRNIQAAPLNQRSTTSKTGLGPKS